jgi:hypothetical protein
MIHAICQRIWAMRSDVLGGSVAQRAKRALYKQYSTLPL